ncbi:MAG: M1 family metallopeptidase [Phycisphaerales bacterium]|nr:M1 family metallopeptidase [Phycisphaerales bacterium]
MAGRINHRISTLFLTVVTCGLLSAVPQAWGGHPPSLWQDWELHEDTWLDAPKWEAPDAFRQLDEILPTPTDVRLASGAPGPGYWQQKVDYDIKVRLDAEAHRLDGSERITYRNNSPHTLTYLWMQIDQNRFRQDSIGRQAGSTPDLREDQSIRWLRQQMEQQEFEGGAEISRVESAGGAPIAHTIIGTMMRIDLPKPLKPGDSITYDVDWNAPIIPSTTMRARSGYEWFVDDNNAIYEIAQWFPRLCAYTDDDGWQNKQFTGRSEFALEFGDYDLAINVPRTFVVASSGVLQNDREVLTAEQRKRLKAAETAERPMFVITPEEAQANEDLDQLMVERGERGDRTWRFRAENVRDVAWAASPKFAWDAWGVEVPQTDGQRTMAMSFFPNEGEPMWSRFSTQAVAHTVEVYSRQTIPYPYPVAISVNGPVGGMEYPMICFNGPRPEPDGTYTERTKKGLIGVIIHEVGHFWFPMIINSDERQWTWMDEGINTFVQFLAQEEWSDDYQSRRGEPQDIISFMIDERQRPIMTHGESILQRGPNAYAKPATALNILRETVLGRENFDYAFREYCRRWAFKHPEPADFFRTMDDASGVDLDWFWRGWFYSTDHVDIAVEKINAFTVEPQDPDIRKPLLAAERDSERPSLSQARNAPLAKRSDRYPELLDFYDSFDELDVTPEDRRSFERFMAGLEDSDREVLDAFNGNPLHFTVVRFRNHGGLVMPLPLEITYEDGRVEAVTIPVEIWKLDPEVCTRMFVSESPIVRVTMDPARELADADRTNNTYPPGIIDGRFAVVPSDERRNPMQAARVENGRPAVEANATKLARRLATRWGETSERRSPVKSASTLLADMPDELLQDPWEQDITLELSSETGIEPGTEDVLATMRSHGPDGEAGTRDDIELVLRADGTIADGSRGGN